MLRQSGDAFLYACSTRVAQTGRPILISEVSPALLQVWTSLAGWNHLEHFDVRSLLVVPLRWAGRLRGSVLLWREGTCQPFTDLDLVFAEDVAVRLGVTSQAQPPKRAPHVKRLA
jgi:GAF domain-containing protein